MVQSENIEGEHFDFGPSNEMSFLGPSKHMRWLKTTKNQKHSRDDRNNMFTLGGRLITTWTR